MRNHQHPSIPNAAYLNIGTGQPSLNSPPHETNATTPLSSLSQPLLANSFTPSSTPPSPITAESSADILVTPSSSANQGRSISASRSESSLAEIARHGQHTKTSSFTSTNIYMSPKKAINGTSSVGTFTLPAAVAADSSKFGTVVDIHGNGANSDNDTPAYPDVRKNSLSSEGDHSSHSQSHDDEPEVIYMTNAASLGFSGYEKLAKHESLDYHTIHNEMLRSEIASLSPSHYIQDSMQRWLLTFVVGLLVGFTGFLLHFGIDSISSAKFQYVNQWINNKDGDITPESQWKAFAAFAGINTSMLMLGSILIVYFCPAACGSGIPEVKGFLNGAAISRAMNVKTFFVKFISALASVASSLPVGPEGPMIHMGAMIGGGMSQSRSKTLGFRIPCTQRFHTDRDRRDFIAMVEPIYRIALH